MSEQIAQLESAPDTSISTRVRAARGKFLSMAAAYSLGVLNDNFFKQAIMLMVISYKFPQYQAFATAIFTLPFILFAAPAGWLSDRFPKRSVIIGAKTLELVAMSIGAIGVYFTSWPLLLVMLFIMALQSTIFSPALNGSIPELYPTSYVTTANGRLRMVVTISIMIGIALAGICLDRKGQFAPNVPMGQAVVAGMVIGFAILGLLISFGVPKIPSAGTKDPFPIGGPIETIQHLLTLGKDHLLIFSIICNAFFWFLASLQVQLINQLGGVEQMNFGAARTSALLVAQMIGIGAGGLLAGKLSIGKTWHRVLIPTAFGMALPMAAMTLLVHLQGQLQIVSCGVLLFLIGLSGGLFMVPLESYIQIRPSSKEKGRVWASANFVAFIGISFSAPAFWFLNKYVQQTANSFGLASLSAFAVAFALVLLLPQAVKKGANSVEETTTVL